MTLNPSDLPLTKSVLSLLALKILGTENELGLRSSWGNTHQVNDKQDSLTHTTANKCFPTLVTVTNLWHLQYSIMVLSSVHPSCSCLFYRQGLTVCIPGCPGTMLTKLDLNSDPFPFVFPVLGSKAWATTPSSSSWFYTHFSVKNLSWWWSCLFLSTHMGGGSLPVNLLNSG